MAELLSENNIDDKLEDNYSYYCLISLITSLIFVPSSAYTVNARWVSQLELQLAIRLLATN